jgi:hypothetical protein
VEDGDHKTLKARNDEENDFFFDHFVVRLHGGSSWTTTIR